MWGILWAQPEAKLLPFAYTVHFWSVKPRNDKDMSKHVYRALSWGCASILALKTLLSSATWISGIRARSGSRMTTKLKTCQNDEMLTGGQPTTNISGRGWDAMMGVKMKNGSRVPRRTFEHVLAWILDFWALFLVQMTNVVFTLFFKAQNCQLTVSNVM